MDAILLGSDRAYARMLQRGEAVIKKAKLIWLGTVVETRACVGSHLVYGVFVVPAEHSAQLEFAGVWALQQGYGPCSKDDGKAQSRRLYGAEAGI